MFLIVLIGLIVDLFVPSADWGWIAILVGTVAVAYTFLTGGKK